MLVSNKNGDMCMSSMDNYLSSVLTQDSPQLGGKRVSMFLHGTGLAATFHSLKVAQDATPGPTLEKILASFCAIKSRLDSRTTFAESMKVEGHSSPRQL